MKAERRHELKTNSLERSLERLPEYWRDYGSRILLIVLVAAIFFMLVRYWNDKKAHDAELVATNIETAHTELRQLERLPALLAAGAAPSYVAENREKLAQQVEQSVSTVLNSSKDPKQLANANLTRGDLNWTLANFPALPGADTQPSLAVPNRDALLAQAQASYQRVIDSAGGTDDDLFYARLGIAAVAENLHQWDKAREQYNAIANSAKMATSYKEYATEQLSRIAEYESTPLIVAPPAVAPAPPPTSRRSQGPIGPMPLPAVSEAATSRPTTRP